MMNQIPDYTRVLQDWREQVGKSITQVLTRINEQAKQFKGDEVDEILRVVNEFHREIGRADQQEVDVKWFPLCIDSKKKLKKMVEAAEKQKKKEPILQKKVSNFTVIYPEELASGSGPNNERILKFMFKSFVTNFEESMTDPKTVEFIRATFKQLKYKYGGNSSIHLDLSDTLLNKRVLSICNRLGRESSRESKQKMLRGEITAKELSNDDEETYFDQKTRDNIKRIQREELERMQTGFYDDMKKRINKDASEECRYCHKKSAYCEDQKQIRASDEPMTRFMRCNACEKAWRD